MSPLAEAPRALLSGVEGVVFDVDDTLTTRGLLTPDAYAALFDLRDAGLGAIAVTGRPLGWTDAMAASWPIDLAVGENGAGWARRVGRELRTGTFGGGDAAALDRLRAVVAERMPHVREASDQPARRCDAAWDVAEQAALSEEDVAALVALIEAAGARALVSSVHAHAVFGPWDKALGVERAIEASEMKVALDRWLFVGDSGNDAACFARFELSVAVANVRAHLDRLPVAPRWITERERGEGFAELVGALGEARADA